MSAPSNSRTRPGERLVEFARGLCLECPAVRRDYAIAWTELRPGVGDLEFAVTRLVRAARSTLDMLTALGGGPLATRIAEEIRNVSQAYDEDVSRAALVRLAGLLHSLEPTRNDRP